MASGAGNNVVKVAVNNVAMVVVSGAVNAVVDKAAEDKGAGTSLALNLKR